MTGIPFSADSVDQRFATDENAFMRELEQLAANEKTYKANVKKGLQNTVCLMVVRKDVGIFFPEVYTLGYNDEKSVEAAIKNTFTNGEEILDRKTYTSPADFDVKEA